MVSECYQNFQWLNAMSALMILWVLSPRFPPWLGSVGKSSSRPSKVWVFHQKILWNYSFFSWRFVNFPSTYCCSLILNEYYSSFFPKTCQFTKRGFPLRHPRVARLPERGGRSSKRWSWRQLLRRHWTIVKIVQNAERIRWTGPLQWKV